VEVASDVNTMALPAGSYGIADIPDAVGDFATKFLIGAGTVAVLLALVMVGKFAVTGKKPW
jgi:hypothetical protein